MATMLSVSHPIVPEWTWVRIWLWSNVTTSRAFGIPIPIVTTKIAIATRYRVRAAAAQPESPPIAAIRCLPPGPCAPRTPDAARHGP